MLRNGLKQICPKCGSDGTHGLMMVECDGCINTPRAEPDVWLTTGGFLRPNPAWADWNDKNKAKT